MKTTIIVNAFGAPGAGKTTAAWELAAELKKQGLVVEYVSEYAKELVWDENYEALDGTLKNQRKLYEEQKRRIDRLVGKVDAVITDSPILLNLMYCRDPSIEYDSEVLADFKKYNNFNFFVERGDSFEQQGRIHDLNESKEKDKEIKFFLNNNNIYYGEYSHHRLKYLADNIRKYRDEILRQKENNAVEIRAVGGSFFNEGREENMKCVVNGRLANAAKIEDVPIPTKEGTSERIKLATFTLYAPDPNGPKKKITGDDGTEREFTKGISLNCKAWGENADYIRDLQKGDIVTGAATVRYGESSPLFVITKIDPDNQIHRQMSNLITAYTSGEISQIFESDLEKEPPFRPEDITKTTQNTQYHERSNDAERQMK